MELQTFVDAIDAITDSDYDDVTIKINFGDRTIDDFDISGDGVGNVEITL